MAMLTTSSAVHPAESAPEPRGRFRGPSVGPVAQIHTVMLATAMTQSMSPRATSGAGTRPDALLDQLDPPPLTVDGRPLTDLLRPAYQALPAGD